MLSVDLTECCTGSVTTCGQDAITSIQQETNDAITGWATRARGDAPYDGKTNPLSLDRGSRNEEGKGSEGERDVVLETTAGFNFISQ